MNPKERENLRILVKELQETCGLWRLLDDLMEEGYLENEFARCDARLTILCGEWLTSRRTHQ